MKSRSELAGRSDYLFFRDLHIAEHGIGVLSCNRATCLYDTSMCGPANGGFDERRRNLISMADDTDNRRVVFLLGARNGRRPRRKAEIARRLQSIKDGTAVLVEGQAQLQWLRDKCGA